MSKVKIISIDIGSTFTKGANFLLEEDNLKLIKRAETHTTIDDLTIGFDKIFNLLKKNNNSDINNIKEEIFLSSSAKGGLSIVAMGLVPDLTSQLANETVLSAGGKILKNFSYKLTSSDIKEMERLSPDIILFSGGTDGGNESYNLHNAKLLAQSNLSSSFIYCGNKNIADEINEILQKKEIFITENIMPEIGKKNIESAHKKIRSIFLSKIVRGIGLDKIVDKIKINPIPTPLSVFNLCREISSLSTEFKEFCLIDMGGATTDFYSACEQTTGLRPIILRGLQEPFIKRTVEGDLGMRISAKTIFSNNKDFITKKINNDKNFKVEEFENYIEMISSKTEYLPANKRETFFDNLLASSAIKTSVLRHSGKLQEIFTADGKKFIQRGKDLSNINKLIVTGGFLSKIKSNKIFDVLNKENLDSEGNPILAPKNPSFLVDVDYLIPLVANISQKHNKATVNFILKNLKILKG